MFKKAFDLHLLPNYNLEGKLPRDHHLQKEGHPDTHTEMNSPSLEMAIIQDSKELENLREKLLVVEHALASEQQRVVALHNSIVNESKTKEVRHLQKVREIIAQERVKRRDLRVRLHLLSRQLKQSLETSTMLASCVASTRKEKEAAVRDQSDMKIIFDRKEQEFRRLQRGLERCQEELKQGMFWSRAHRTSCKQ